MCRVLFLFILEHLYIYSRTLFGCVASILFSVTLADKRSKIGSSVQYSMHTVHKSQTERHSQRSSYVSCTWWLFICLYILCRCMELGSRRQTLVIWYEHRKLKYKVHIGLSSKCFFYRWRCWNFKKCAFNQVEKGTANTNLILLSSCSRKPNQRR